MLNYRYYKDIKILADRISIYSDEVKSEYLRWDPDLIIATLAQLEQMGACQVEKGGCVSVDISPNQNVGDLKHTWQLWS